jgi:hypothetical protein
VLTAFSVHEQLRLELQSAGLLLEATTYQSVRSAVSAAGATEVRRLEMALGPSVWRRGLACLGRPYPDGDSRRVLGFGRMLCGFAVAPLGLAGEARESVLRLGALCNFIVATYDHLVDSDPGQRPPLHRGSIAPARHGWSARRLLGRIFRPPAARLMQQLVGLYFAELERLPHAGTHIRLRAGIERLILHMYDAEGASLNGAATARLLRRKAALPFVVMGLPGWLAVAEEQGGEYWWHLRWLYRLGDLFGWVDDAVDLEEDRGAGRPNRLLTDPVTAVGIATEAGRLLAEWRERVRTDDAARRAEEEGFRGCLVSWLGGVG